VGGMGSRPYWKICISGTRDYRPEVRQSINIELSITACGQHTISYRPRSSSIAGTKIPVQFPKVLSSSFAKLWLDTVPYNSAPVSFYAAFHVLKLALQVLQSERSCRHLSRPPFAKCSAVTCIRFITSICLSPSY